MKQTWWFALLLVGGSVVARAASFDCKLAKTPQEKAICATPRLSTEDEVMASAYKAQLAAVPATIQALLRNDQRQFLAVLATGCSAAKPQPLARLAACMEPQVVARIEVLQHKPFRMGDGLFVDRYITVLSKDDGGQMMPADDEENPGYGTLAATWPQAVSDAPQWTAWNAAVLRETQAMAAQEVNTSNSPGWVESMAKAVDATITASVSYVDARMVSTNIEEDFMGHSAAHPGESTEWFHWLRAEKRELKVSDVFTPGDKWQQVVAAKCRSDLAAQGAANGASITYADGADLTKELMKVIESPRNWSFHADGLMIHYPDYTVAPRVSQPQGTVVRWASLRPYLAAGFAPPHG